LLHRGARTAVLLRGGRHRRCEPVACAAHVSVAAHRWVVLSGGRHTCLGVVVWADGACAAWWPTCRASGRRRGRDHGTGDERDFHAQLVSGTDLVFLWL